MNRRTRYANPLRNPVAAALMKRQIVAELRRLHDENEALRGFAQEVRRTGDTRLASMAIAALAQGENT